MDEDLVGTIETLVEFIDAPDFDVSDPEKIRDLIQFINIQCRSVLAEKAKNESSVGL